MIAGTEVVRNLLQRIRAAGIDIWTDDKKRLLWDRVPPEELRAQIDKHKVELLELVPWKRKLHPAEGAFCNIKIALRDFLDQGDVSKLAGDRLYDLLNDMDYELRVLLAELAERGTP